MKNDFSYPVPARLSKEALIDQEQYKTMYQESLEQPKRFWGEQCYRDSDRAKIS